MLRWRLDHQIIFLVFSFFWTDDVSVQLIWLALLSGFESLCLVIILSICSSGSNLIKHVFGNLNIQLLQTVDAWIWYFTLIFHHPNIAREPFQISQKFNRHEVLQHMVQLIKNNPFLDILPLSPE